MRKLQFGDVFSAARLIKELDLRNFIADAFDNARENGVNLREAGIDLIFGIIEKATDKKAEALIYQLLAGPLEVTPNDVKGMDPCELFDKLFEIADPEEWRSFFERVRKLNQPRK